MLKPIRILSFFNLLVDFNANKYARYYAANYAAQRQGGTRRRGYDLEERNRNPRRDK